MDARAGRAVETRAASGEGTRPEGEAGIEGGAPVTRDAGGATAAAQVGRPVEVPVSLVVFGAPPRRATAVVIPRSPAGRIARALAGLGACWGLAVAAAFVPVAHFVLVPTLLVAGPVVAVIRLREERTLVSVRGACSRCGLEQEFRAGGRFRPGRTLDCAGCRHQLVLSSGPPAQ